MSAYAGLAIEMVLVTPASQNRRPTWSYESYLHCLFFGSEGHQNPSIGLR